MCALSEKKIEEEREKRDSDINVRQFHSLFHPIMSESEPKKGEVTLT